LEEVGVDCRLILEMFIEILILIIIIIIIIEGMERSHLTEYTLIWHL